MNGRTLGLLVSAKPAARVSVRVFAEPWASQQVGQSPVPLRTCESVVSEAWFLLRATDVGCASLFDLLERGALKVDFDVQNHLP